MSSIPAVRRHDWIFTTESTTPFMVVSTPGQFSMVADARQILMQAGVDEGVVEHLMATRVTTVSQGPGQARSQLVTFEPGTLEPGYITMIVRDGRPLWIA